MTSPLWFLIGIPLAVETLAAALSFRDLIGKSRQRAAALERLVAPTLAIGLALWLATPLHWGALGAAAAVVLAWQAVAWTIVDRAIGRAPFAAQSIDTDEEA